jgi:hypothetical protein
VPLWLEIFNHKGTKNTKDSLRTKCQFIAVSQYSYEIEYSFEKHLGWEEQKMADVKNRHFILFLTGVLFAPPTLHVEQFCVKSVEIDVGMKSILVYYVARK